MIASVQVRAGCQMITALSRQNLVAVNVNPHGIWAPDQGLEMMLSLGHHLEIAKEANGEVRTDLKAEELVWAVEGIQRQLHRLQAEVVRRREHMEIRHDAAIDTAQVDSSAHSIVANGPCQRGRGGRGAGQCWAGLWQPSVRWNHDGLELIRGPVPSVLA